ncbi:MAG: YfjI family protein, partial [Chloroflexota bacterium]|nr:YfjI family protein [Chloroflexota bacterium]
MSAAEHFELRPKGYDISDWLEDHDPQTLRRLIDETCQWDPTLTTRDNSASLAPPTFPVEVFPPALRNYLVAGADALGVSVDMVAVPMLGFAAGAIGNTRALRVKPGWVERAVLWLAVIGAPGSGKSPALDHARHPIDVLQQAEWETFRAELEQWEQDAVDAKAQKSRGELAEKPVLAHYFTTDATMEALAFLLVRSPGLAMVRDELVGWVRSHDAYRKAG